MASTVTLSDIEGANKRINKYIHKTPVFTSQMLNKMSGKELYFKAENFQKTGSFKARGAFNAVLDLKEKYPNLPGVVTHSSGNHGQALAYAAQTLNIPCTIVVPSNTTKVKKDAIQGYGGTVVLCLLTPQSREETCNQVASETGKIFVPPYDYKPVVEGQGTIALEFLEQVPDLDAIFVPVGGGGMISGIAVAAKAIKPSIKIFAVEPQGKNLQHCLEIGERSWPNPPKFVTTIAEGIRVQQLGQLNWSLVKDLVEKTVFTVSDDDIVAAMRLILERLKVVVEVTSAIGVAAVLSEKMKELEPSIIKIGVVFSGGNADLDNIPWIKQQQK